MLVESQLQQRIGKPIIGLFAKVNFPAMRKIKWPFHWFLDPLC